MIFSAKNKIAPLQEHIKELEDEIKYLSQNVRNAQEEKLRLIEQCDTLYAQVNKLESALSAERQEKTQALKALNNAKSNRLRMQEERDFVQKKLNDSLEQSNELRKTLQLMTARLSYYDNLTTERFLNLGANLFSLEQLTLMLQKAQSDAFIRAQREQQQLLAQKMVNVLSRLLYPVHKERNLLNLLGMINSEGTSQLNEVERKLQTVHFSEIIAAHATTFEKDKLSELSMPQSNFWNGVSLEVVPDNVRTTKKEKRKLQIRDNTLRNLYEIYGEELFLRHNMRILWERMTNIGVKKADLPETEIKRICRKM